MGDRTLRIAYVDDDISLLNVVKGSFNKHPPKALKDIPLELTTYEARPSLLENLAQTLLEKDCNLCVLDYRFEGTSKHGYDLAREIYEKNQNINIIMQSGYDLSEHNSRAVKDALEKHYIKKILTKPISAEELAEAIREWAFKPLSLAIVGLGKLGGGFLEILKEEARYIKNINLYSRTAIKEDNYEGIKECYRIEEGDRIHFSTTLEDAISGTDCVLLCSGKPELAKEPDRSDLFRKQVMEESENIEKAVYTAETLKELCYNGLVIELENTIGERLNLMSRIARSKISEYQFSSPLNIDVKRIIEIAKKNLENLEMNESEIKDLLYSNSYGVHGAPNLMIPPDSNITKEKKEILEYCLIESYKVGEKTMRAARKQGRSYFDPQRQTVPFLEELSHYKRFPSISAYCFYKGGYIALPSSVMHENKGIIIMPNDEKMKLLVSTEGEQIKKLLMKQSQNVGLYFSNWV